jgi:hypothetical protein
MRFFTSQKIATIIGLFVQPFAMYSFLRIIGCRFFVSAGLALLIALAVYHAAYFILARRETRK